MLDSIIKIDDEDVEEFKDKLKTIKNKCGISQNTHWQDIYTIDRKEIVVWFMSITYIAYEHMSLIKWCLSEREYEAIYKILSKLEKIMLKIDNKLEDTYKELIIFNDCVEYEKEMLKD